MRVVLCTCPPDAAEPLARGLVEKGAACVNVVPGVTSFYVWDGALQRDAEALLVVKADEERLPAIESALGELHPYSLPEWVVLAPDEDLSSAAYRDWVHGRRPPGG